MLIVVSILAGLGTIVLFFLATYTVVKPNEAHIVVFMGRGRKFYSPSMSKKSAYFFIPVLMKRYLVPLTNVKFDINDIRLNDIRVAPFVCDVIAWVNIDDPILAAERLDIGAKDPFDSLFQDLNNIVQAIARAVSMKQEIIEIMRDRKTFAAAVSEEVNGTLKEWGVNLVNLEVNDIRDDRISESTVIKDYESMRRAQVRSSARIEIAEKDREAVEAEQENLKRKEVAKAEAAEVAESRIADKEKRVGLATQERDRAIAEARETANSQAVKAARTLDVGRAGVERDAHIEAARGVAEGKLIEGEKEAQVVRLKGEADGAAVQAVGLAEAESKNAMAQAMAKFNDAATVIEKIRAWTEIQKAQWTAYGQVAQNADIKVVSSGKGASILGVDMNAETGADLGQFIESMGGVEKLEQLADAIDDE